MKLKELIDKDALRYIESDKDAYTEAEIELKPCPFCRGKAKVSFRQYRFIGQYDDGTKRIKFAFYGMCNRCKAKGSTITGEIHCGLVKSNDDFRFYEELAAEAWNRRC